ncbi:hypothetical protein JHK82_052704 [Glycine max]|nr:hypothetical protein JHK86_052552 [Glycine max]KAG4926913.1 hypothetical protein JHK85_053399 [Glycine max]KAG5082552.1 hypothetical protein JHK84_052590 [Glycine max]KAG5085307.1 hypothetical protein JHK82_052704 [Glycine max]
MRPSRNVIGTLGNGGGEPPMIEQMMAQMEDMRREMEDIRRENVKNLEMQQRANQAQATLQAQATNLRGLEGEAAVEQPRDFSPFMEVMMINSGTNEVKCKLFIGTLTRVSLDWFSALPDNSITYFDKFSLVFVAQFVANKEWLALTINLFYVPQQLGKSLKGFHMRFNGVVVWVTNPDKRMVMATFCKGLRVRSFGESLVCLQSDTMTNVYLE